MKTIQGMKLRDVLRELTDGPYAWPGGYPKYFIMADGEAASFAGVQAQMDSVAKACVVGADYRSDFYFQWLPIGVEINWEDADMFCCMTNERIPSAYAETE